MDYVNSVYVFVLIGVDIRRGIITLAIVPLYEKRLETMTSSAELLIESITKVIVIPQKVNRASSLSVDLHKEIGCISQKTLDTEREIFDNCEPVNRDVLLYNRSYQERTIIYSAAVGTKKIYERERVNRRVGCSKRNVLSSSRQ